MSVLHSLATCVYGGILTIIFVNAYKIKHDDFKRTDTGKKWLYIRQAKHQRSSGLFENDSINKVQSMCWGTW